MFGFLKSEFRGNAIAYIAGFLVALVCVLLFVEDANSEELLARKDVVAAQTILFENDFGPCYPDGVLGEDTTFCVEEFQYRQKLPVDGKLTPGLLVSIKEYGIPIERQWAAVAITKDRVEARVFLAKTRISAEDYVREKCRERARVPDECTILSISAHSKDAEGWIVSYHCQRMVDGNSYTNAFLTANAGFLHALAGVQEQVAEDGFDHQLDCVRTILISATGDIVANDVTAALAQ